MKKFIEKAAKKVSTAAGGADLVDYLGTRIAQRKNKSIKQTTSGKAALKSAGKVALNIASIAGTGALARGAARMGVKTGAKAVAKKKVVENALDKKYRLQDEYDYAQRALKNAKKAKNGKK